MTLDLFVFSAGIEMVLNKSETELMFSGLALTDLLFFFSLIWKCGKSKTVWSLQHWQRKLLCLSINVVLLKMCKVFPLLTLCLFWVTCICFFFLILFFFLEHFRHKSVVTKWSIVYFDQFTSLIWAFTRAIFVKNSYFCTVKTVSVKQVLRQSFCYLCPQCVPTE